MIWEDECYLLSKRKFRENANIINIFTKEKGKVDGIVYGGTSRKIKKWEYCHNYFMQGAFYAHAYEERTGVPINNIVIIMAVENEKPLLFVGFRENR